MNYPSPKELDDQCKIKIARWIDVDSKECKEMDDNFSFTKKCLRLLSEEPAYLFTDILGRIWGKGENGYYYPFHFEYKNQLIGYRISKRAAN